MMILKRAFVTFFQNRGRGRGKKSKRNINAIKKNWEMEVFNNLKYFNHMKTCLGQVNKKEINEIINK